MQITINVNKTNEDMYRAEMEFQGETSAGTGATVRESIADMMLAFGIQDEIDGILGGMNDWDSEEIAVEEIAVEDDGGEFGYGNLY